MAARPLANVLLAALLTAAVVAHLTVVPWLPLPGGGPHLVLVVVVASALALGTRAGAAGGFGAGLALDLLPPADHAVGQWALVLCLAGYLAGLVSSEARSSTVVTLVAAGLAALVAPLAFTLCGVLLGDPRAGWSATAGTLPAEVLYAVMLTPPAVAALRHRVIVKDPATVRGVDPS
jgi:rod shape-determining protein MreD